MAAELACLDKSPLITAVTFIVFMVIKEAFCLCTGTQDIHCSLKAYIGVKRSGVAGMTGSAATLGVIYGGKNHH
jgi:hypothetical protein